MTDLKWKWPMFSDARAIERADGWYFEIRLDGKHRPEHDVGPASESEARRMVADFQKIMRDGGALDIKGKA